MNEDITLEKAFVKLTIEIKEKGLLDRQLTYYLLVTLVSLLCLFGAVASLFVVKILALELMISLLMGFLFVRVGFLFHDGGHYEVFKSRRANNIYTTFLGLVLGVSTSWLSDNHGAHHKFSNDPKRDPDIVLPIFAFTNAQAAKKRGVKRFIAKHQYFLMYPITTVQIMWIKISTVRQWLRSPGKKLWVEVPLFLLHHLILISALVVAVGATRAIALILVQHMVSGFYLAMTFVPNHCGMEYPDSEDGNYIRRQIVASRNVVPTFLSKFLLGGAGFQIEHHLFPTMPRPNLEKASPTIKKFCEQHRLQYTEVSMSGAYKAMWFHLYKVSTEMP